MRSILKSKYDPLIYLIVLIEVYSIYDHSLLSWFVDKFYIAHIITTLSSNFFLSVLSLLLVYVGSCWLAYKRFDNKPFRLSYCILFLVSALLLIHICCDKPDYSLLLPYLIGMFILQFIIELFKLFDDIFCHKKNNAAGTAFGFVPANTKEDKLLYTGWDKYAEVVVKRLINTDNVDSALAVALVGEWGSGKTTFLQLVRVELEKNYQKVITFNPWTSMSSTQMIKDYFSMLKNTLEEEGLLIDDAIDRYVSQLLGLGPTSLVELFGTWLGLGNNSDLAATRDEISKALDKLDGHLYVLIDDLDRLQKEEMFEVMKLIRNTADFKNIIYIAAYDKGYVTKTLEKYGIEKPDKYLEKIFQVELQFPKFEEYLYVHHFKELLKEFMLHKSDYGNTLNNIEHFPGTGIQLSDYLKSFRDAKRFVNNLILIIDYLDSLNLAKDLDMKDLFLVELLNFTDEPLYSILKYDNSRLIKKDGSKEKRYVLSVDESMKISERSGKILNALFPSPSSTVKQSYIRINNPEVYASYFSYRPLGYQMGVTEFYEMLKLGSEKEVKNYMDSHKDPDNLFSKSESLYSLLLSVNTFRLDKARLMAFFYIAAVWTKNRDAKYIPDIAEFYQKKLLASYINQDCRDEVKEYMKGFFKELRESSGTNTLQCILCYLMPIHVGDGEMYPDSIFSSEELNEMITENTRYFLKHLTPAISDLLKDNTPLHNFLFFSLCYKVTQYPNILVKTVEDLIIEYFKRTKDTNDHKPFFEAICCRTYPKQPKVVIDPNEAKKQVEKYFYDSSFYKRFLQECFANLKDDERNRYLKENYIV